MEPGWRSPPQGALSPEKGEEGRRACGTEQPEADKDPSESTHTILAFTSSRSQSEDGLLTNDVLTYELPPRLCGSAFFILRASLVAQRLKRLPAMRETWVQSLGRGYPLEKEMATHSSILAWRIPWMEEPGGLQSTGCKQLDVTE